MNKGSDFPEVTALGLHDTVAGRGPHEAPGAALAESLTGACGAAQASVVPMPDQRSSAATAAERGALKAPSPETLAIEELAGEPVRATQTAAPGNGAPLVGFKVVADSGWFAARPSGTEDVYKIEAESFRSERHLEQIQRKDKTITSGIFTTQNLPPDALAH